MIATLIRLGGLNVSDITFQVFAGAFQSSGWPGVVTAVANWFGKSKKGLIFGIWNSHTSLGNILGSLIAGNQVTHFAVLQKIRQNENISAL